MYPIGSILYPSLFVGVSNYNYLFPTHSPYFPHMFPICSPYVPHISHSIYRGRDTSPVAENIAMAGFVSFWSNLRRLLSAAALGGTTRGKRCGVPIFDDQWIGFLGKVLTGNPYGFLPSNIKGFRVKIFLSSNSMR